MVTSSVVDELVTVESDKYKTSPAPSDNCITVTSSAPAITASLKTRFKFPLFKSKLADRMLGLSLSLINPVTCNATLGLIS